MTDPDAVLPSWRPGPTRDALLAFLDASAGVPLEARVACFDNDGTLWCERPSYVQLDFFLDTLQAAVRDDPAVAQQPEFAALLSGDRAAVAEVGLERIALALTGLYAGLSPEVFAARVREFMASATHAALDRPLRTTTYVPMLELLAELRRRDFTVGVVTGGGTEFVRAISQELYGVPPEVVVGSLVDYDYVPAGADGSGPGLVRAARIVGVANEGTAKVTHIQTQLGRRPILAAGNSGGDRAMLEWAAAGDGPTLALLVDHDDDVREFAYVGTAETFAEPEPITAVAARSGWVVASMVRDWEVVFAPPGGAPAG